jgi:hypothetical protein
MEAPRENTAIAITASASTDMDQLATDIVTKLVNPLDPLTLDSANEPWNLLDLLLFSSDHDLHFSATHCEKKLELVSDPFHSFNSFLNFLLLCTYYYLILTF